MKKKKLKRKLQSAEANRLCWVERWSAAAKRNKELAAEVAILDAECIELAHWLLSEWVHVNESKVAELDVLLNRFLGGTYVR